MIPAFRRARPADYEAILSVVDTWFGRPMTGSLPRLFLDHFHGSSTVAEDRTLAGFLIGFPSPSLPDQAYIHFIGVRPDLRCQGLARAVYQDFFERMAALGCRQISAITSPGNALSIAFHRAMGFRDELIVDYHGPGVDRVLFTRRWVDLAWLRM